MAEQMLFKPIVEKVANNSFSDLLTSERKAEIDEIGKAWDFYYGNQEQYIKQYRGEENADFNDKDKLVFNYTKAVVDEYVDGVFAKPVEITIEGENYQETWDDIVTPMSFFGQVPFFTKCQRIAEISDTCVIMVRYNEKTKKVYFEDVRGEFVAFLADPENPKKVGTMIISYLFDTGDTDPDKRFLKKIEIWNDKNWGTYLFNPSLNMMKVLDEGENPYGVIPAIRLQPEEDDNTFYGLTNVKDVVKVNEVYNNLWTGMVQICINQSFSILVTKSVGAINIELSPKKFLKFEKTPEADASFITPSPKINDVRQVLESLRDELLDFSKVPSTVFAQSKATFPASGYALRVQRIPIEKVWGKRRNSYGPSMRSLTKLALLVDEVSKGGQPNPEKYELLPVTVNFSNTEVDLSPQEQTVIDEQELRYNLITPIDLMLRKYPTLTREDAEKKLEENKKKNEELGVSGFGGGEQGFGQEGDFGQAGEGQGGDSEVDLEQLFMEE